MGAFDKIKSKMGHKSDDAKTRMEILQGKETAGDLDDKGRAELQSLRERFGKDKQ